MEIIFWISVILLAIAAFAVGYTVRMHNQMFGDAEDPVPCDDSPGHYEDAEYAERSFIEYFN